MIYKETVRLKSSTLINTPVVVGYIKPTILFPIALINQLSIVEIEAILAHELAHIKRHDYLLNIIQILIETIFYYHPAIWFISSKVRFERENCCDDLAIDKIGSSVSYAKTLIKLQELKLNPVKSALAFSGNKKHFLTTNFSNFKYQFI